MTQLSDQDKKIARKLEKFRQKVSKRRLVNYWEKPDELATKVVISIKQAIQRFPMPGYVRNVGDSLQLNKLTGRRDLSDSYKTFLTDQIGERPIIYDLSVEYFFDKIEGSTENYALTQRDRFTQQKSKNTFTVALSDDTEVLNTLLSHGSWFDFVLGNSYLEDYTNEVEDSLSLSVIPNTSERKKSILANKRIISNVEIVKLLKSMDIDESLSVHVKGFEFDISSFSNEITLLFSRRLIMRLSDNYYSWFADGLTYLRSLRFDYRGIAHLVSDFNVQHFFSSSNAVFRHDEFNCNSYIEYSNWVVRGQGAILVWRNNIPNPKPNNFNKNPIGLKGVLV